MAEVLSMLEQEAMATVGVEDHLGVRSRVAME